MAARIPDGTIVEVHIYNILGKYCRAPRE
eukprot:COSAG02_NODE_31236_length_537_cov_0.534247_2_plen_28_part_01